LAHPMPPAAPINAPPNPRRRLAVLMLVLATLYWGLSFPVIKAIVSLNRAMLPGAGSWFVSAAALAPRFVLAAIVMLAFRWRRDGRPTRAEMKQGLGIGIFAAAGTLLQTDGMQFTDASTSAFLTQFSAILIPAWVAVRSGRNPGAIIWTCCVLVLAGVGILGHFDWRSLRFGRGEWETLLCSVFFTGQILWIGKKEFAGNRPASATLVMFAMQAVVFVALAASTAPNLRALEVPWESAAWVGLTLVLTVFCTIGAFSIMTKWQPRITATEAGLIYCAEPVFASVFALFLPALISVWAEINYPNERATWSLLVGGGFVALANVLVQARSARISPEGG
jgi:drug/metabolite transporter (DMT)-like permease